MLMISWMAILMGAVMAVIMLGFMWSMCRDKRVNIGIIVGNALASWSRFGWCAASRP